MLDIVLFLCLACPIIRPIFCHDYLKVYRLLVFIMFYPMKSFDLLDLLCWFTEVIEWGDSLLTLITPYIVSRWSGSVKLCLFCQSGAQKGRHHKLWTNKPWFTINMMDMDIQILDLNIGSILGLGRPHWRDIEPDFEFNFATTLCTLATMYYNTTYVCRPIYIPRHSAVDRLFSLGF